jgi:hypothetical protein
MADRGLLHSGISLGAQDTVGRNYATQWAATKQSETDALSDIARRRLEGESESKYQQAEIERLDMYGQPIVAPPTPPASTTTAAVVKKKPVTPKKPTGTSTPATKKKKAVKPVYVKPTTSGGQVKS